MITALIMSDEVEIATINGFKIFGHADFSDIDEKDIVCAAVSAIAQTAYLGLKTFTLGRYDILQEPGLFLISSHPGFYATEKRIIYTTMFCGLMEIAKQYPQCLRIIRNYRLKSGEAVERVVAGGSLPVEMESEETK
jgi:uncharacterized protein YsxB (DUF464 family)